MSGNRRETDKNLFKAFWDWATPWAQIIGFAVTCAFFVGDRSSKFEAYGATLVDHDRRLAALESSSIQTNQMVKDMVYYFKVPHKE